MHLLTSLLKMKEKGRRMLSMCFLTSLLKTMGMEKGKGRTNGNLNNRLVLFGRNESLLVDLGAVGGSFGFGGLCVVDGLCGVVRVVSGFGGLFDVGVHPFVLSLNWFLMIVLLDYLFWFRPEDLF